MSVSTILPQSGSDLDTDQGEIIDEKLKQVAQTVNQMLLKTIQVALTVIWIPLTPHTTILQTQSVPTLKQVTFINTQLYHQKNAHRPDSSENMPTHSLTNFEKTKQITVDIDSLSRLPSYIRQSYRI